MSGDADIAADVASHQLSKKFFFWQYACADMTMRSAYFIIGY